MIAYNHKKTLPLKGGATYSYTVGLTHKGLSCLPVLQPPLSSFLKQRHRKELFFRALGAVVIAVSLCVLGLLLAAILKSGYTAFFQTQLGVPFQSSQRLVLERLPEKHHLSSLLVTGFPTVKRAEELKSLHTFPSWGSGRVLKRILSKPQHLEEDKIWIPVSSKMDQFYKATLKHRAFSSDELTNPERSVLKKLSNQNALALHWNWDFLTRGDSQEPELAGVWGALKGSFLTLLVAFCIAFPLSIGASIYLEEFAPCNRLTDWAELHINNLAAVPSILFGILGLVIFDKWLGFPRPSSLLGGATLALMMCPPLIVMTRLSLRGVPGLLREAAYAMGASSVQVVFHQVLPVAFPGILSGTMMVLARMIGESAPLLMVGMVAFIADVPQKLTDPATVLPIQIFSWAKSPHPGFLEKTSGAILGLLAFLILLNALALFIRRRMEYRLRP